MKSQKLLKIVNPLLFFVVLGQITSAILMENNIYPWGVDMGEVHGTLGGIFVVLLVIHLILNRRWVINTFFKAKAKPAKK